MVREQAITSRRRRCAAASERPGREADNGISYGSIRRRTRPCRDAKRWRSGVPPPGASWTRAQCGRVRGSACHRGTSTLAGLVDAACALSAHGDRRSPFARSMPSPPFADAPPTGTPPRRPVRRRPAQRRSPSLARACPRRAARWTGGLGAGRTVARTRCGARRASSARRGHGRFLKWARRPLDWGDPDHVRSLLGIDFELAFEPGVNNAYFDDVDDIYDWFVRGFGPVRTLVDGLDADGRAALKADIDAYHGKYAGPTGLHIRRDYLVVIGRRR
ncbi:MAG: hypothetical protein R3F55_20925 [Alphaproteobacteria bacterium]